MRRMKLAAIGTLTLSAIVSASSLARGGALARPIAYEVSTSQLHVRGGPGTQHASVGLLPQGQVYPALETAGGWARIQLGGAPGRQTWCSLTYLRATSDPIRWVLASELNVRAGPATRFRALGQLPKATPLAVVATTTDGWAQVFYEGTTAWVLARWLGTAPPSGAATPPAAPPRSRAGFIQLAANGSGFESYTTASRRWGRPSLIYGLERAGRRWAPLRRDRIGVGDVSLEHGGYFPPHAGHREGREVDVSPVRSDGLELPVSIHDGRYSRTWTGRLLDILRAEVPTELVLFNDAALPGVVRWPGHDDHFHLRARW